ncbi:MAG: zinc ribbon domain-containing protein, partial [Anaerolineales bacterium]|nr:zinc ribbon domain-containing protein [Anaerolineales bacterium]
MPTYDYGCMDCRKRASIYQTYADYGTQPVSCPKCGSANLKRLINRVRVVRSEESRMDSLSDPSDWDSVDEDDPRAMAHMMRRMGQEMGEDLPPEFDEVVDRMEAGEDPDQIEKDFPELASGGDGMGDD